MSDYDSSYSWLIFSFFFYVLFLSKDNVLKITSKFFFPFLLFHNIVPRVLVSLCSLLLMLSGDVEINSRFLSNCKEYFSICHWNLNSISANDYSKLFLLKAYIIPHKFDINCFSETYLDSTTLTNDDKLQIPGYTLIGCCHPSNTNRDGVCIYYRTSLPLRVKILVIYTNVWALNCNLGIRFVILKPFIDPQVNLKVT